MKKNVFAETYKMVQALKAEYKAAADESSKADVRARYNTLMDGIKGMGDMACRVWREYEDSKDSENTYLDIYDCVWDKDVAELVACLRENGIDRFTFSSTWSGAVDTAWLFTKNGCTLEGLIEINSRHKTIMGDEYEKAHGYLFKVN